MTVSTTNNRINQVADGIVVAFVYDFIVNNASHMLPYLDNVLQVAGFTVNGVGSQSGGDVTFDVAPANGVTVTLQRVVPLTQLVDYLPYDPFPAETHEGALDKLTLQLQQVSDEISRAIKADVTTAAGVSYTLPVPEAGSFLQWNITEDGFINVNISDLGTLVVTTPYTELFLAAVDAPAARAILEVYSDTEVYNKAEVDGLIQPNSNVPARNIGLTKDVLTQPATPKAGMSSVIYTGNGATQDVLSGIDMFSAGLGGLVWLKGRSGATGNRFTDSVRGVTKSLASDSTAIEATEAAGLTAFNVDGFSIGADLDYNTNTATYVGWSWKTNKKTSGVTNRNKPYTCHFNTSLGFSIVGYEGDGAKGHEIPHHLGVAPELSIFKSREGVKDWVVKSSLLDEDDYFYLNRTDKLENVNTTTVFLSELTASIADWLFLNTSAENYISYHFASVAGVSKIGKYIGTGEAGNYVDCGFKPAFVMIKNLTAAFDWVVWDGMRGDGRLTPNSSVAEAATVPMIFSDTGFIANVTSNVINTLDSEYIFMAFAESSIDATKAITDFALPTNADELEAAQNLLTFANGFNVLGQVDEVEQVAAGTLSFGAGHESKTYYLYRDKGVSYGRTEVRPLVGLTRDDADEYGEQSPSDAALRTTSHHFDYESDSGIALASGEQSPDLAAWQAFNKDLDDIITVISAIWQVASATLSWLQYKHSEKRILKSWRIRATSLDTRLPRLFTIEGSDDGLNWTAIDSSYTASNYVGNGNSLWGDLQDVSANVTAYLYHRINTTANNGDASFTAMSEMELNTIIAADYYLIDEAKMFNASDVQIDRVYYGECKTDAFGNVISSIDYAPANLRLNGIEVHGDAIFHGDVVMSGRVVQTVNIQDGEVATGTTIMPADNTIPQKTEGNEYMILPFTPTDINNVILIEVNLIEANPSTNVMSVALFQGATANALASVVEYSAGNVLMAHSFTHKMIAGTIEEIIFRVRAGLASAGTTTFNGISGGRVHGGVLASSITITEIQA